MDFTIRVANSTILIHSVYPTAFDMCKDYLMDDTQPDFELSIDDDMLNAELAKLHQEGEEVESLKVVERLIIHRRIAELLLERDTILMHGAVIAVNNASYMFTGKSGTGKTTHIQKWLENVENSFVVNGDKPFVLINHDGAFSCGSPWCGKEHFGTNTIVPLRSIVFMERSTENHIEEVSFKAIFPVLLEQTYKPSDAANMRKTLGLLAKLRNCVSFYKFYFDNYKEDAFSTSFDTLTCLE